MSVASLDEKPERIFSSKPQPVKVSLNCINFLKASAVLNLFFFIKRCKVKFEILPRIINHKPNLGVSDSVFNSLLLKPYTPKAKSIIELRCTLRTF